MLVWIICYIYYLIVVAKAILKLLYLVYFKLATHIDLLTRFQHNKIDNTLHIDLDLKNNYLVYYVHIFCDITQKSMAIFLHEVWQRFILFCNCNWSLKTSTRILLFHSFRKLSISLWDLHNDTIALRYSDIFENDLKYSVLFCL